MEAVLWTHGEEEVENNCYNLNILSYISTAEEEQIDLKEVNAKLTALNERISASTEAHNAFLKELGLELFDCWDKLLLPVWSILKHLFPGLCLTGLLQRSQNPYPPEPCQSARLV